ncbi:MAG TPA: YegP family protein, partial [Polyangiaceae bacterium]|nr:YegP family protein [Polyangiaceae bacterium]
MAHPRFMISKSPGGQFTFNLTAANGAVILASERYTSHSAAVAGARSVQAHAGDDGNYEHRTASDGRHYFVLIAGNHEIIGTSQ